ncbi:MAG: hypothetical protein DMG77_17075 [Acidobacteria bacterium]|nr:MAG: hypothetical protein DMG77_17075 [Acidobacteriota bacterium]
MRTASLQFLLDNPSFRIYLKSHSVLVSEQLTRTGRPKKPEHLRRSKLVLVKLTLQEHRTLRELSEAAGKTVSDLMREGGVLMGRMLTKGKGGSTRKEKSK